MDAGLRYAILTVDVEGLPGKEDFITGEIISALYHILKLLERYNLTGLFFITGTVAKKIACYPKVLELLNKHEIGYHSSSHSVKPRIFEYTDLRSYERAVEVSRERETSSIDPFTGNIVGPGGIHLLKQIFPEKKVISFRAPFLSWSPPHLEALREYGFEFDFSTALSNVPVCHKGITFLPYPTIIDSFTTNFHVITKKMLSERFMVFLVHPSQVMFKIAKPFNRLQNQSSNHAQIKRRPQVFIQTRLSQIKLFFSLLYRLRMKRMIKILDSLEDFGNFAKPKMLDVTDIRNVYEKCAWAPKNLFGYHPRFLHSHLCRFLEKKEWSAKRSSKILSS